jgi:hypothetical protein
VQIWYPLWAILHQRMGWSVQRPVRRAQERDEVAIQQWVAVKWPRIKANARRRKARIVCFDESGASLLPNVRRTWAPVGRPPVLRHPFNWKRASMAVGLCYGVGGGCSLFFHVHSGSYDTVSLIEALKQLRVFLGGQKATVLWDGLPAHRSTAMAAFVASQRDWLVVERLPGYAPELNPAEQLWANLRATSWPTSPARGWVGSSARPGRGSRGSVGPGTCRTRSCATPACRSPERHARLRPDEQRRARRSACCAMVAP